MERLRLAALRRRRLVVLPRTLPIRTRLSRRLLALPALLALLICGASTAVLGAATAPRPPFGVAVLPFQDLRDPGASGWLGHFLRERIAAALRRAPQVGVLGLEAAAQWQQQYRPRLGALDSFGPLAPLGVRVVVQGSTQEVLGLAEIRLYASTADGALLSEGAGRIRVHLRDVPPAEVLRQVLGVVQGALLPGGHLSDLPAPADWAAVEQLYSLLAAPIVPGDRAARPERLAQLNAWSRDPALGGRAHQALAQLLLEQAHLYLPAGAGRELMLGEALQHAAAALRADPTDTHRQALKAELHYFLKQDYEAKTEASIARIRNPMEGLAFIVLGLTAGLSTGEATEQFRRALAVDPYIRKAARPSGVPPYQGGLLEPYFVRWERLQRSPGSARQDEYGALLEEAIGLFEQRDFDQAEVLFRRAAEREDNDVTPWLYLNRILIEIGHPAEAVAGLRRLAEGNPQEAQLWLHLGTAQARSGAHTAALESFGKALAEQPGDVPALHGQALSLLALERLPEALNAVRAVLHADPDHAAAWAALGAVQMRQGDLSAAEEALVRALELDVNAAEARRLLDEVQRRLAAPSPGQGQPSARTPGESLPGASMESSTSPGAASERTLPPTAGERAGN